MNLKLVVLSEGNSEGQAVDITLPQFLIGRDPQCHMRPVSTLISKRHCAFLTKDDKVFVRDFDSTNGTFVNGQQIEGEMELNSGDTVKVGPLEFRVDFDQPTAVNQPTPPPGKSLNMDGEPQTEDFESEESLDLDDDAAIAALLMEDDGTATPIGENGASEDEVSDETTLMEMNIPPELLEQKKQEKKKEKKDENANTSSAAADILAQMYRRR